MNRQCMVKQLWTARGFLLAATVLLLVIPGISKAKSAAHTAEVETTAGTVGAESCRSCHEEIYKTGFERTPHFQTTRKGGMGCESCHGPGAEHVAGGGDVSKIIRFERLSREEASARCLECHGEEMEGSHFTSSEHAHAGVGCTDCNSPHHAKGQQFLLVANQPGLCYSCHATVKADFGKPFHHRVNESLVKCTDCHDAHGTTTEKAARSSPEGDVACFKCHADKQGPFVFEHLPVKTEGCQACHTPHGSTNPRFLRVSQVNLMCLQCHTLPTQSPIGPAHNQSQKYQACTMCHPAIHGSNADRALMK
jgi:DmsE family decaheme c-type cytochrome